LKKRGIDMAAIYGNGVALSERVLDYLWSRQTVSMNNVANVDTPGFKSQYITFEEELDRKLTAANSAKTAPKRAVSEAINSSHAWLNTTWNESSRLDGNNVDMDQEQVEIVRTAYEYQYMLSSISNDFTRLKSVAKAF
jgi:flagellar basal-body rod protein FlgB